MKSIYLILAADVKEVFLRDPDPVLRYVCKALDIYCPPFSGPLYELEEMDKRCLTTIEKLESRTWREYFEAAMKCIEESEYVIVVSGDVCHATSLANDLERDLLEDYCALIGIEVKYVSIPNEDWHRIVNSYPISFVYNMPPCVDTDHPKN